MNNAELIKESITSNHFRLPSPPDIYLRILEIIQKNGDLQEIESILRYDASITARLIQVANSPALRGNGKVSSVLNALSRLGTKFTSNLVLGLSMRDRFSLKDRELRDIASAIWERGVYAGAASSILAKELRPEYKFSPEVSLTAGLLHNIGFLPILDFCSSESITASNFNEVAHIAPSIGSMILTSWGMDASIVECTALANDIPMATSTPVTYLDLVALVLLARDSVPSDVSRSYGSKVGIEVDGVSVLLSEYSSEISELIKSVGI